MKEIIKCALVGIVAFFAITYWQFYMTTGQIITGNTDFIHAAAPFVFLYFILFAVVASMFASFMKLNIKRNNKRLLEEWEQKGERD